MADRYGAKMALGGTLKRKELEMSREDAVTLAQAILEEAENARHQPAPVASSRRVNEHAHRPARRTRVDQALRLATRSRT